MGAGGVVVCVGVGYGVVDSYGGVGGRDEFFYCVACSIGRGIVAVVVKFVGNITVGVVGEIGFVLVGYLVVCVVSFGPWVGVLVFVADPGFVGGLDGRFGRRPYSRCWVDAWCDDVVALSDE